MKRGLGVAAILAAWRLLIRKKQRGIHMGRRLGMCAIGSLLFASGVFTATASPVAAQTAPQPAAEHRRKKKHHVQRHRRRITSLTVGERNGVWHACGLAVPARRRR